MEHDEAIRSGAAERYVARELSPAERDAFEDHFFDCKECAEDVRFELTFAANAREVWRETLPKSVLTPVVPEPRRVDKFRAWWRLRPALALSFATNFALAAGLAVVVLTRTRDTDKPRFTQIYFAPGPAHGADEVHMLAPGENFYAVRFLTPGQKSARYSYRILASNDHQEASGSIAAPAGQEESLYLQIPVKDLHPGTYTLEIHAGDEAGEMVSRSRFQTSR